MLRIAFMGAFSASLVEPVRRQLSVPCEIAVSEEVGIVSRLSDVDVLVTMALTQEIGRAASRLKLVQVPGVGLDRIDRSALPHGVALANVSMATRRVSANT
jgi:lactate dehydrogenase-like 2-hydroxyacid dehydrogenase